MAAFVLPHQLVELLLSLFLSSFFGAEITMKLPPPDTKRNAFYHAHLSKNLSTNTFPVLGAALFRTRRVGRRSKWERLKTDSVWGESLLS